MRLFCARDYPAFDNGSGRASSSLAAGAGTGRFRNATSSETSRRAARCDIVGRTPSVASVESVEGGEPHREKLAEDDALAHPVGDAELQQSRQLA